MKYWIDYKKFKRTMTTTRTTITKLIVIPSVRLSVSAKKTYYPQPSLLNSKALLNQIDHC